MDSLTDHYIISGFGRVGRRIAEQLQRKSDTPFVIVETTPSAIAFAREAGYLYYEGDATRPLTLEAVHIGRAGDKNPVSGRDHEAVVDGGDELVVVLHGEELRHEVG
jgi:Trk K+ transport system NAD-binding subunit